MNNKTWRITIGIQSYWVTEAEKDYYLKAISGGAQHVQLRDGLILGANFIAIASHQSIEESKGLDTGKWACEYGRAHRIGMQCFCESAGLLPTHSTTEPGIVKA